MNFKKLIFLGILSLIMAMAFAPSVTKANQISDLIARIQQLTDQLNKMLSLQKSGACAGIKFNRTLGLGATGNDVKCLQSIIGNAITGTYGPFTATRVKTFQSQKGLTASGSVDSTTITALNATVEVTAKYQPLSAPLAIPLSAPVSCSSVTQFGITWYFSSSKTCGQFANGDWWVIGPVTITKITPESIQQNISWTNNYGQGATYWINNGTMINPTPVADYFNGSHGFDSSIVKYAQYDDSLNVAPSRKGNLVVPINTSVVSSVSKPAPNANTSSAQLDEIEALTVLGEVPPEGSFRPPMAGNDKSIHSTWNKSNLDYSLLKNYAPVDSTPDLATVDGYFEESWTALAAGNAVQNLSPGQMPNYGRDQAQRLSFGLLSLHLNYSDAEKEKLYIALVQYGIDIYGSLKTGMSYRGAGGLDAGRKSSMVLAGVALNDPDIKEWSNKALHNVFAEDQQTYYVSQNDVATPRYMASGGNPSSLEPGQGCTAWTTDKTTGAIYCSRPLDPFTSSMINTPDWTNDPNLAWRGSNWANYSYRWVGGAHIGNALAIRLLGNGEGIAAWNWPAFFDYEDRHWSIESQGQSWSAPNNISPFVFDMWTAYRVSTPVVGHSPVITGPSSLTVNEDSTTGVSGTVVATDPDVGDVLTYYALSGVKGVVTINLTTGVFNYKPNANAFGSDSFTVTVKDNHNNSASKNISVTINPMPDAPTAANITATAVVDTPQAVTLQGNDVDGDALTYAITTLPIHGTATISGDALTYTPASGYLGADNISYKATDSTGLISNIAQISITVSSAPSSLIYSDLSVHESNRNNPVNIGNIGGSLAGQFTISGWIYRNKILDGNATNEYSSLIYNENWTSRSGYYLGDLLTGDANEKYCFRINTATSMACEDVSEADETPQWVNYTGVYDGATLTLYKIYYVNGVKTEKVFSSYLGRIFKNNTDDSWYGEGVLGKTSNLKLFNTALTEAQILAMVGQPPVENDPLAVDCLSSTNDKSVTMTATASGGNGTYAYSWQGTDGLSGTTSSVSKTYTTGGWKTGTVTVTSGSDSATAQCSALVEEPFVCVGCTQYAPLSPWTGSTQYESPKPCAASCITQSDGSYSVSCDGTTKSKCDTGKVCQVSYGSSSLPIGSQCITKICTPAWQNGPWSACVGGWHTRTVTDTNNCSQSRTDNWLCIFN